MKETTSGVKEATKEGHIPFSQLAAYGAGGIIPIALFNIAGILVGLMGNISLGLSAFWLGFILIIPVCGTLFPIQLSGIFRTTHVPAGAGGGRFCCSADCW